MQTSRCGRGALTLLYDFCSSAQKSLLRRKTGTGGFILLYDEGTVISDFTPDNIAIQLFNATATALNCISQICCFHVALISCLAIKTVPAGTAYCTLLFTALVHCPLWLRVLRGWHRPLRYSRGRCSPRSYYRRCAGPCPAPCSPRSRWRRPPRSCRRSTAASWRRRGCRRWG